MAYVRKPRIVAGGLPNEDLTCSCQRLEEPCQDGETGRPARLRIPKSSISKRSFSFHETTDLREENEDFRIKMRVHEGRVETSSF